MKDEKLDGSDIDQSIRFGEDAIDTITDLFANVSPTISTTHFTAWAGLVRSVSTLDAMLLIGGSMRSLDQLGVLIRPLAETWVATRLVILGGEKSFERLKLAEKFQAERLLKLLAPSEQDARSTDIETRFGLGRSKELPVKHRFDMLVRQLRDEGESADADAAQTIYDQVVEFESFLSSHVLLTALDDHVHERRTGSFEISTQTRSGFELAAPRICKATLMVLSLAIEVAQLAGIDPSSLDDIAREISKPEDS